MFAHARLDAGSATSSKARLLLFAAAAAVALPSAVFAGVSFTGATITENFDSLPTTTGTPSSTFSATPGIQTPIPGLTTWDGTKLGGSGSGSMNFVADTGAANSGALYSYGSGSASTERALGSLASGTNIPGFGVAITNNSSFTIALFTLSFTAEQWRSSTATQNRLAFAYGVGNGTISDSTYLSTTDSGMIAFAPLDAVGQAPVGTNGATDGNDAANRVTVNVPVAVNVPIGSTLYLRWQDFNDNGNDAGIGVDDLSFTAVGAGKTLTWNPGSTTWNTDGSNQNWLDGATASSFSNNDIVTFGDTGVGSVTVAAGGVSPIITNVSNNSGTYTFTGGAIGGAQLIKTGNGTVVLNNSNAFGGGLAINGGHLVLSSDAAVGVAGAGIFMGGGTLVVNANISLNRGLSLTGGSSSAVDIGAGSVNIAGPISGSGGLVKNGSGTLLLSGTVSSTGSTTLNGGTLVLAQPTGVASIVAGDSFDGELVIQNAIRANLNGVAGPGSTYGGTGNIRVLANGAQLSMTSGHAVINKNIVLNPNNIANFVAFIGGGGGNRLTLNNPISGTADVNWASSVAGGGAATIELNAVNTYTGKTLINNGGQTPGSATTDGFPAGSMVLGIDNPLPPTSDLIVNTIATANNGPGRLDLNGHTQTFASMSTGAGTGTGLFEITNAGFSTGTIVVNGNTTPATAFNGIITDGPQDGTGASATVLVKDGSGTLAITGVYPATYKYTLGLSPIPVRPYSGGAIVKGGVLLMANNSKDPVLTGGGADLQHGRIILDYNDGANGTPNTVKSILTAGYASNFATGQIKSTTADTSKGLGWKDDSAAKQVTIAYTYFGDANLDGQVDVTDLGSLATNWQTSNVWSGGDFNYDGFVDVTDLGALATNWQQGVGNPLGRTSFNDALAAVGLGGVSVPEPASLGAVGLLLAGLRRARSSRVLARRGRRD